MRLIEYEFTMPDGSKAYEIIDPDCGYSVMLQIEMFVKIYGAVSAYPIPNDEVLQ